MICPFCLAKVKFKREKVDGRRTPVYLCSNPECNEVVPALYVRDYKQYPPVVVSAIGFRGHGKTVYFATLFYALKKSTLAQQWADFFTMGLNEESLQTVYDNMEMLEKGELPPGTPKNFPRPTMIRVAGVPTQRNCTLLCYDTGGECFERPTQLVQFAGFVQRAQTAMLLVSLPDLEEPRDEMHKLLNTYVVGMGELGARTQEQHLVVVYTKADKIAARFTHQWQDLMTILTTGSVDGLGDLKGYMEQLRQVSARLREFTLEELQAYEFLNAATANFKSVEFAIISALGAEPDEEGRLLVQIDPSCILDPLLWMMEKMEKSSPRRSWWPW